MANFFADSIKPDSRFLSATRIRDRGLLEPATRRAVLAVMNDAAAIGIPLLLFETYRSQQRQQQLFQQRATQLEKVGVHHYGLACDLVKDVGGQPSWKGDFAFLGKLARKHGLIWGGDWGRPGVAPRFYDGVHVQRVAVKRQNALLAGRWYPDDGYDPWRES
jgi:hypothetical protein